MTNQTVSEPIVVLISGTGSIMAALIEATKDSTYGGQVVAVISDKKDALGLAKAQAAGIPTHVVELSSFNNRDAWNEAIADTIAEYSPRLVVLAGFMRLLNNSVIQRFPGRIINTHPALLPSFPGAHGVRDALAYGVKVTGCTAIIIDEGVDTGPIVAQAVVDVRDNDSESSLHERIKEAERDMLVSTVGEMLREGWNVQGRHVRLGN